MSDRPDIVLVVLDDLGFSDLGCFGAEIRTPNLDCLAAQGVRFNRFETRAICTPSRAALLSGRNPHEIGITDLPAMSGADLLDPDASFRGRLSADVELLPETLRARGYRTSAIGKWHLAGHDADDVEYDRENWPTRRGFDSFYGFLGGHTDQFSPALIRQESPVDGPRPDGYHLTEDLVQHAIAALDRSGTPAFVYLATGAAHSPHQVPESFRDLYRGDYDVGWDVIRERRLRRQIELGIVPPATELARRNPGDPAWVTLDSRERRVAARFQEIYAAFVDHTDAQLGRLFRHITERGRDTIVVVLSDNGPAPEAGRTGNFRRLYRGEDTPLAEIDEHLDEMGGPTTTPMYPRAWAMAGATPFRRYKLWPLAGGMRTPLIISRPNHVNDPGAVRTQFVELIDLAPTIVSWIDESAPPHVSTPDYDGAALSPILVDPETSTREIQYFELRSNRAIVKGDWKAAAVHVPGTDFADDRWMLFDLAADFSEAHDVASTRPELLAELISLWETEATRYSAMPLREMTPLLRSLKYFDDGHPPQHP